MKLYAGNSPRTLALVSTSHVLLFKDASDSSRPCCHVSLLTKLEAKSLHLSLISEVHGLLGLIHHSNQIFLVAATQKEKVATPVTGQSVNRILGVGFWSLSSASYDLTMSRDAPDPDNDAHPCTDLRKLLSDGSFCYSNDCDLTNNVQLRGVGSDSLVLDTYQEEYMWNYFMMSEMIQFRNNSTKDVQQALDANGFLTTAIRGFAKTVPISVEGSAGSMSLVSRQSWLRAGTRFNARGVDDDGNVANFVETETVVHVAGRITLAYVQLRGSIPVFWEQDASQLTLGNPRVQITRSAEATAPVFAKHFNMLAKKYGGVHVVNLLSSKPAERELSERYRQQISEYRGEKSNPELTEFDFHAQTKGGNYAAATRILRYLTSSIETFEYFSYDHSKNSVMTKQTGVFRTNCLDCLDRTNVVQTIVSGAILDLALQDYGIKDSGSIRTAHDQVWADNGDQISQMYTGTNALKSSFSRNGGKMTLGLFLSDATKSVTRMYQNNFVDSRKQITIDTLLGRLPGASSRAVTLYDPVVEHVELHLAKISSQYQKEQIRTIFAGTFNLNGFNLTERNQHDQDSLAEWLVPENSDFFYDDQPDVYCLGFQEVVELNASNLLNVDYSKSAAWVKAISKALGSGYTLLRSEQMSSLLILFFAKKSVADKITSVEGFNKKTGLGGIAGNKGAVAIRFNIGATSFCVINSHLASGQQAVYERNSDYESIMSSIYFSRKGGQVKDHDNVIWLGDLNYRLSNNCTNEQVRAMLSNGSDVSELVVNDQLLGEIHANRSFQGFSEAEIHFIPTYKFDNYTNIYDTSEKQRVPSWTDRVLFKGKSLEPLNYDSVMNVMFSDHKPVYCLFESTVMFVDAEKKQALYKQLYEKYKKEFPMSPTMPSSNQWPNANKKSISLVELGGPALTNHANNSAPNLDLLSLHDPKPIKSPPPVPASRKSAQISTPPPGFSEVLQPLNAKRSESSSLNVSNGSTGVTNGSNGSTNGKMTLQQLKEKQEKERLEKEKQEKQKKAAPPPVPIPRHPKPVSDLPPGFGSTLVPTKVGGSLTPTKPVSPNVPQKPVASSSASSSQKTSPKVAPPKPPKPQKHKEQPASLSDWKPLVPK